MNIRERPQVVTIDNTYQLHSQIYRGTRSSIYTAKDMTDNTTVALKLFRKAGSGVEEEASIQSRLLHPHILPVKAFNGQRENPYIILEYASEGSLQTAIGRFPIQKGIDYIIQAAEGLAHAHKNRVLHRDIKPSNLLLTPDVKIADWGSAILLDGPRRKATGGSLRYAAPEYITDPEQASTASDLYSLGRVAYEVFTGRRPYTLHSIVWYTIAGYFVPPPPFKKSVGERGMTVFHEYIEDPVRKALASLPSGRQSSVGEFADELRNMREKAQVIFDRQAM